jgi:hypothetical protein
MHCAPEAQDSVYFTEEQAAEYLKELEEKHNLFQYDVAGYSVWQLLRSDVGFRLMNVAALEKPVALKSRQPSRVALAFREVFNFLFVRHSDYVVKTVSSALREKDAGLYKDVYFDDLIKELGGAYKIETINSTLYHDRRKLAMIPSALTTSTMDLVVKMLSRLPGSTQSHRIAKQISLILQSKPTLMVFTPKRIMQVIKRFYWLKQLYRVLLRRIDPVSVLVENTRSGYPIWAAAQELGISTVEVQHGIFSRNHPDVLSASATPYRKSLIIPDKIFLFGEYWRHELKKTGFYGQELIPVGSPQIDHYRQIRIEWQRQKAGDRRCVILLTTQGLSRDSLIQFAADFLDLAQGKLDYSFYIKLHPAREISKSAYEQVLGSKPNVHILLGSEDPSTYELLSQADFHVSLASASHYDALGLGIPTIVLPLAGYETVMDLVDAGHAYLARTPQDLLEFILASRTLSVPPEVSAYYFTSGAVQNMLRELKHMDQSRSPSRIHKMSKRLTGR